LLGYSATPHDGQYQYVPVCMGAFVAAIWTGAYEQNDQGDNGMGRHVSVEELLTICERG
jgi:hypothetical protein